VVELEFSVRDTGIGLSAEHMQRIFHPFTQADTSITRQYGGTGLGLTISKQLVDMMGGRIWVESVPGKGSDFRFTARFSHGKSFTPSTPASSEELAAARARLSVANILLAEDNPFNQQVAEELLEETGATVMLANNGREALALLEREHFDIVLMDVQMPEMDGYEATRQIRATPRLAGQKVIAMTANAMAEDRERCLASGMNDFISKPIDPDQMVLVLAKWLPERAAITPEGRLVVEHRSSKDRRKRVDRRAASDSRREESVIDLAILARMVRDDPARVRKFALKFLETARKILDEMYAAHTGGDLAVLGGLGHKLKSSARTVGATGFADLCQALESAGKANDLQQAGLLLQQLHPLLERIARQVERETA
jgi:CheY-like chemotaxis protein